MYIIRHPGISCRTTAEVLHVRETKATQARQPAIDKVAALLIADPIGTVVMLCEAMIRAEQEIIRERLQNPRPPDAASSGKLTRRVGHP